MECRTGDGRRAGCAEDGGVWVQGIEKGAIGVEEGEGVVV